MSRKTVDEKDVGVVREGTQIVLPNGMTYDSAIEWLQRKKHEEMTPVAFHAEVNCAPLDGLVAFHRALAEKFGWVDAVPTPGFFGSNPPKKIEIPVGYGKTQTVFYGRMEIPGVSGYIKAVINTSPPGIIICGETYKRDEPIFQEVVTLTREILASHSIYKGKAVRVNFGYAREERSYDPIADAPSYLQLNPELEETLIFQKQVARALNVGLFTPIEQTEACRQHRVPLKRGVLMFGQYGCGKTLTANVTATKATRNGWTFVYLNDVRDLKQGLEFAAQYAPAVVFAEDIDRVLSGERSISIDEVLNTIDGVDTKNGEIITVFTTNHIERINPAMLRMGRLDTLIQVLPPDAAAAEALVNLYGRGLFSPEVSLTSIGRRLAGKIPAFIREVVERSKIAAIGRLGGNIEGRVEKTDLLEAADAMEMHDSLIWRKQPKKVRNVETLIRIPSGYEYATPSMVGMLNSGQTDRAQALLGTLSDSADSDDTDDDYDDSDTDTDWDDEGAEA